jgi:4-hydroxybenzoate polyprenyltransferase
MYKAGAYLTNIRVAEWRAYIGMALFGYIIGTNHVFASYNNLNKILQYLITIVFYLAFSFTVNNCYDVEGDKLGEMVSKNPIASGKMSKNEGLIQSGLIAFTGIMLSYLWFNEVAVIIYSLMVILSWAYSAPPLRFKSAPFLDMLSHGLFFGSLIVLYGLIVAGNIGVNGFSLIISIYFFSLILQLRNHIEDAKEDSAAGIQTTVTKLGLDGSKKLLMILYSIHIIIVSMLSLVNVWVTLILLFSVLISVLWLRRDGADFSKYLRVGDFFTTVAYVIFVFNHIVG